MTTQSQETQPTETPVQDPRLAKLNQFTRRTHTLEEVYLFEVKLCDNQVDRDGERFTLEALEQLKTLFVGRTGIFDHNPKGEHQTARLYDTQVVSDPSRTTTAGEPYTYLKGMAYMVRTPSNADLIREIDGGIKKEVSISCTAAAQTCSICGKDRRKSPCRHRVGQHYGGKTCHILLSQITDAYEWSFVAVPAQREAGVTKQYRQGDPSEETLGLAAQLAESQAQVSRAETMVRQDIIRLRFLVEGRAEQDAVAKAADTMTLDGLIELRERLRLRQRQMPSPASQLAQPEADADNHAFRM